MSQVTQPRTALRAHTAPRRAVWIGAVLALAALGAVVLVLALGGREPSHHAAGARVQPQAALRTDGGPEESGVAAAVGARPAAGPDESRIAAAISGGARPASSGPDESRIAAAIAAR
ncbi:MAG: hypothetical protein QOI98_3493 [Solirubrobacteraceae bacterium]|jgi:hypothetical protein|nr:hypothetical protein [Solirubrobacteraceae bacterium]